MQQQSLTMDILKLDLSDGDVLIIRSDERIIQSDLRRIADSIREISGKKIYVIHLPRGEFQVDVYTREKFKRLLDEGAF